MLQSRNVFAIMIVYLLFLHAHFVREFLLLVNGINNDLLTILFGFYCLWVYLHVLSVHQHRDSCFCLRMVWVMIWYCFYILFVYSNVRKFISYMIHVGLQSVTKYLRLTLVFMWKSGPREKFNRYFSGLFC